MSYGCVPCGMGDVPAGSALRVQYDAASARFGSAFSAVTRWGTEVLPRLPTLGGGAEAERQLRHVQVSYASMKRSLTDAWRAAGVSWSTNPKEGAQKAEHAASLAESTVRNLRVIENAWPSNWQMVSQRGGEAMARVAAEIQQAASDAKDKAEEPWDIYMRTLRIAGTLGAVVGVGAIVYVAWPWIAGARRVGEHVAVRRNRRRTSRRK